VANRPVALVTGASMGLGAEFARQLAASGHDLILTARSADKLESVRREIEGLHGVAVRVIAKDLADRNAPTELFNEIRTAGLEVDVLVNNAGFGGYGVFHESDLRTGLDMIQVNVTALTHLTRLFVSDMVTRRRGRILNVASTAGFLPGPLQPVYYATKAYVLSFTEAIANELKGTGVTATVLCPGPTPTGFQERANVGQVKGLRLAMRVSPEDVVRAGVDGMMKGKAVVTPGVLNRLVIFTLRLVPRAFVTASVRRVQSH
jgi:short-subunit dehydrogenase